MRSLARVLVLPAALAMAGTTGAASAESGAAATPITVGGGWVSFEWGGGVPAQASGNPYEFTHSAPVYLRLTDAFCRGDQFRVYDAGVLIGDTSPPSPKGCGAAAGDPDPAWVDARYSHGLFQLPAGAHSITIETIQNPYNEGAAYLRADDTSSKLASLGANKRRVKKGKRVRLTALVSPCPGHEGHIIELKRGPKTIGSAASDTACMATFRVKMKKTATFTAVSPQQDADHGAAVSNPVRVRVKKRR